MADLLGTEVFNGLGLPLGLVARVLRDGAGDLAAIVVREHGLEKEWTVEAENILLVRGRQVFLKGPRQGFHITPLAALASRA